MKMNKNSFKNIARLFFIGLIIIIWFFTDDYFDLQQKWVCEKLKERELKSVVKKSYIDYDDKGLFTIVINYKGKEVRLASFFLNKDISRYLETGDSIYKPSGKFKYYIYKKCNPDSVIILENGIDCEEYSKR